MESISIRSLLWQILAVNTTIDNNSVELENTDCSRRVNSTAEHRDNS